jgi:energy-coupling factor transport system ATP-binding protein
VSADQEISLRAVGWGWRHGSRRSWALRGVDLEILRGERVLICGPSGSGKSTFLRAVAGLLDTSSGEQEGLLEVGGVAAQDNRHQRRLPVGLLLQDPNAQLIMSCLGDDIAFGPENLGLSGDEIRSRVGEALRSVDLHLPLSTPIEKLSGGQVQRAALAGVLALRPEMLLLDEPTSALDSQGAQSVRQIIESLSTHRERTLLIIEHRIEEVVDLVDRMVVFSAQGELVADGSPDDVLLHQRTELHRLGLWLPLSKPAVSNRSQVGRSVALGVADVDLAREKSGPTIIRGLSESFTTGEFSALTGPNGSGKTTLALALAGLLPPQRGEIRASETLSQNLPPSPHMWRSKELKSRIGMVFQNPEHQFLRKSVGEEVDDRLILERLGIAHLMDANPFTLSGGEQRRLSIAIALDADPLVLILDEPTFGLDRAVWESLVAILISLRDSERCIIAATHDRYLINDVADRIVQIECDVNPMADC